jgi:hypothetical protein
MAAKFTISTSNSAAGAKENTMSIRKVYTTQELQRLQAIRSEFNTDPKMVAALTLAIDLAISMSEHFLVADIAKFTALVVKAEPKSMVK